MRNRVAFYNFTINLIVFLYRPWLDLYHYAQIMKINLLLFGIAKEVVGSNKAVLDVPDRTSVIDLKRILKGIYPDLHHLDHMSVAINSSYARPDQVIGADDEVALIPPVSGG
jgi:molybdopterin converting factor small subunit